MRPLSGPHTAEAFLAVARVTAPHGVRGEVRCDILTDFPERLPRRKDLLVGERRVPHVLERARFGGHGIIVKMAGVDSRQQAESLRGETLYIPEGDAAPLPEGSYYWHEIIGLKVRSTQREELGEVVEILQTGSNDVYVVRGDTREILVPAIQDVIREIDVEAGIVTVELLEGLR
ncbi:MAG: 16S rRNA processing protein RimM [Chloroflexi bacterium]|nr:16S rRNA processing protein RimM [Chloroflexota bacterium]